jgi:hypothetical protein
LADGQYSGSFIGDTVIYSPTIGGQQGYISDLFKVGNTNPIVLDARTSTRKIYIGGVNDTGSYSSGSTYVYMDGGGRFSLKDKLTWDGNTLNIDGNINIAGGSAATSISNLNTSVSNINSTTSSLNTSISNINSTTESLDSRIFTNALGRIIKTPSTGTQAGLYLGNTNLGYYNGSSWKTYMDNTGLFYLTGSANGNALLWNGSTLVIRGNIQVSDGTSVASSTDLSTGLSGKINSGSAAADVNSNVTNISGGKIRTGIIESTGYSYTSGNFSTTGTQINLDNGLIRSKNFAITSAGDAFFKGDITGASGTFSGTLSGATITGGTINIGPNKFSVDSSGNSTIAGNLSLNTGGTVSIRGYKFYNGGVCTSTINGSCLCPHGYSGYSCEKCNL